MDAIRVIVVDDHAVVREGTCRLLEQDPALTVVGQAGNGRQALMLIQLEQPDVVLLDLALPDMSGIEVARRIHDVTLDAKIVVLSAYDDEDYVYAAMEVGVAAYLLKTVPGSEVIRTIHAVTQGQVILHPEVAAKLRQSLRHPAANVPMSRLTQREMEVLRLAARGLPNKAIARELFVSVRTVEGHFSHIFAKLGVSSRTEAVLYGVAHHWFAVTASSLNAECKP
jgi:DNA-binding NarL/FixJ family response regulator